jgi:hypothetical protein
MAVVIRCTGHTTTSTPKSLHQLRQLRGLSVGINLLWTESHGNCTIYFEFAFLFIAEDKYLKKRYLVSNVYFDTTIPASRR